MCEDDSMSRTENVELTVLCLIENGDKILLGVFPPEKDLAERSEKEQRAAARRMVDRFMKPGKPAMLSSSAARRATPAFDDEVYRYSRQVLLDW